MQGCAERAAAQHAPHTPNISLHGARYAAGTQQLSAALKQSSHRASSKKEKGKSSLPGQRQGREFSVIPRGGAAVGFRDAIAGPARRFVSAW